MCSNMNLAGIFMQYRRAIRHPQPAEREYLAAQSTGSGVHVGKHVEGGWLVDAAMAESSAEEAGIVRGDLITEISRFSKTHRISMGHCDHTHLSLACSKDLKT